jgi:acetyltransferase-like isoleucine patch superfamily enzyme
VTTRLEHDWFPRPLPENVLIGERSWVYSSYAFIHFASRREPGVLIGRDTGVYDGSFFELGPKGSVTIGDFCSVVGAIIASNADVRIGDHTFIAHRVVIADSSDAAPSPTTEAADIEIGPNVWIGAHSALLGGVRIGEGSIVGAGTIVDSDVPPYSIVAGNPARVVRRVERTA